MSAEENNRIQRIAVMVAREFEGTSSWYTAQVVRRYFWQMKDKKDREIADHIIKLMGG